MTRRLSAVVHLVAGTGHVVRREEALLFLPRSDDTVRAAFVAASSGEELQAVASATVAAGFDVGPYVCVGWRSPARVMVFGDLAVETDQPSVPMFTGAGSRTWVEQTIPVEDAATVAVADAAAGQADHVTDLRDGIAHAAGFLLTLTTGERADELPISDVVTSRADDSDPAGPADPTTALPAPTATEPDTSMPEPSVAEPSPPDQAPPRSTDVRNTPDTEPASPPSRPTGHDVASDVARDPALALAAIQAAAMNEEGEPVHAAEPRPPVEPAPMASTIDVLDERPPLDALDEDHTLPPPEPGELLGELDADAGGALVEAKVCPQGHPNPAMVATCAICGGLLSPGAADVTHVRRPSLGSLRLDDGVVIDLDQELLIGRNPARDREPTRSELQRVQVLGDKVSRSHLEVRFQGWDVLVVDCGSTNGSFVVPHPGGQVVALEPHRAHLLEPEAVVYFGSRSFTVVGRGR